MEYFSVEGFGVVIPFAIKNFLDGGRFWPLRPFGAERPGAAALYNTTDPHSETLCTEVV
jgi:hypothetical protein